MTEEYKWIISVDSAQAAQAFETLIAGSQQVDANLAKIVETLAVFEEHLQNISTAATGSVAVLSEISGGMAAGFDQVSTQLSGVLGRLTTLINLTKEATEGSGWGQGASAVERYSDKVAGAQVRLAELRAEVGRLSGLPSGLGGIEFPVGQLFPSLEEFENLAARIGELSYATSTGMTDLTRAQLLAAGYVEELPNVSKYLDALKEIEVEEARLAALEELRSKASRELAEAKQQEMAAQPEGRLATFFTEEGPGRFAKFDIEGLTGFEESMLHVLLIFDQIQSSSGESRASVAEVINALEQLGAVRLQSLGTSIRVNIRTRLEEGVVAAENMAAALQRLNAIDVPERMLPLGMEFQAPEAPTAPVIPPAPEPVVVTPRVDVTPVVEEAAQVVAIAEETAELTAQAFEKPIPRWRRAFNTVVEVAEEVRQKLVGGSIVPDMVREINEWLDQIGQRPIAGIERIGQKFLELQDVVHRATLMEKGGVPGFGTETERAEFIKNLGTLRGMYEQVAANMFDVMSQADVGQWQLIQTPQGIAPVAPEAIGDRAAESIERYNQQAATLVDTEDEIAAMSLKVDQAMRDQAKTTMSKAQIQQELRAGTMGVTEAEKRLTEATEGVGKGFEKSALMASRFLRHITWILQGIVVWGAYRAFQNLAREAVDAFQSMEFAAAQAAFVTESSVERMMQIQMRYAQNLTQYGIEPTQAAPAITMAERFGMDDPAILEYAAQLSMITGEEVKMEEATHALMSIMRQWNLEAEDGARVMNLLATLYRETPGAMGDFLALMQEGPALAEQMGQSFENNILMIGRMMSYLPERSATTLSGTMGRILTRIYTPDVARKLAQQYGIAVFDPETLQRRPGLEVLDEVAQKYKELSSEAEKAALAETIAGVRQGQSWRDAYVILDNWVDGIRNVNTEIANSQELVDGLRDTMQVAGEEMSAAWGQFNQAILRSLGILQAYEKTIRRLSEGMQRFTRERTLYEEARGRGLSIDQLTREYRTITGERTTERGPTGGTRATEDFLDWLETILAERASRGMRGGRGYATAARGAGAETFGQFKDNVTDAATELQQRVGEAGQSFQDNVEDSSEAIRKTLLTAMLGTGWTPGTSVVDLSDYSSAQINQAMQQSRVDTQRMIGAYRQFLEGAGFGGEAIEEAMQNFTNKLMLQLQFFRLPGNEIRLMEGRDLLFYLSQIEENTRPLEGIWNVPEGMRVWVPIESTFYGEWRNRQEMGGGGGNVVLDSGSFDTSSDEFGAASDEFGMYVEKFGIAAGDYQAISDAIGTAFPYTDAATGRYVTPTQTPTITPETNWGDAASHFAELLSRERPAVDIPLPMPISMQTEQVAQGQALGMAYTGMPTAMSAMRLSMSSMAGAIASQIYYLMIIASNTGQAPTVTVEGTTGQATAESPSPSNPLSSPASSWYMSGASSAVPY